jgi:hypothetical protein
MGTCPLWALVRVVVRRAVCFRALALRTPPKSLHPPRKWPYGIAGKNRKDSAMRTRAYDISRSWIERDADGRALRIQLPSPA